MALTFDDGFLDPYATQAAHDAELAEQRRKEEEAARRAADLRARLAADAEAQARINTPVAPTSTPTLSQPDYTAQNGFLAPQPTGGASLAPSGAELGTPNTVQAVREQLARDQAIAAFTDNPMWQAFNRATDVFQGGQNVAAGLIQQQQADQNQYAQNAFQGVLPQMQQTADMNWAVGQQQGAGLDQAYAQPTAAEIFQSRFNQPLPNLGQTLGQQGPTSLGDFARDIGQGAAFVGKGLDNAFLKPADAYAETAFQALQNSLTSGGMGLGSTISPGLPAQPEQLRDAPVTSPFEFTGSQASAFRARPIEQQLAGSLLDPYAAIPGIGLADDIADLGRLGGRILGRGGREAVEQAPRRTLPALDATTGRLTDDALARVGGAGQVPSDPNIPGLEPPLGRPTPEIAPTRSTPPRPGGIESVPPTEVRRGNLLSAEDLRASKPDYTVKDAIKVAESLERQVDAIPNVVRSKTKVALRKLGKLDRSRTHLQTADGQWVSIYDAAENPSAYALTNLQQEGLRDLGKIIEDVRVDREVFGVDPNLVSVADDGAFLPRSVKSTPEGEITPRGTGGSRLSASKREGSRVYKTAAEAEDAGVVYKSVEESIDDYVRRWERASANTHIKDMLVPFSETSAMRVPPALRARMDNLRSGVSQLRDAIGRLDDKTRRQLDAFLEADTPDIDSLRDTLDNIVITRGKFQGADVPELRNILNQARQQIREMAPEWRKALNNARSPRPGRVMADGSLTPALTSRDFEQADWDRIARHYNRTTPKKPWSQQHLADKGVTFLREGVNIPLRFFQATMDASAILRQQGSALTRHPATTARNIIRSFRDAVDSRAYDEFLGSGVADKWARRGAAVFGDSGDVAEFQASGWMARIPGIKQANNHFVRYNTRNRIEHMELAEKWLTNKVKRPITEAEGEQIARALNRATGVSSSRGSSLESDLLFASRYTRASVEDVVKALSSRGIEGQLARQYLGSLMATATTLSVTSAVMNGIPIEEVLNPFDRRALRRGEIRMNPNFLSVRVAGHDMKPLGSYDSLAALAFVTADAAVGAIKEKDAYRLFDAIGYISGTKGSPVVSFITDLIKGETFEGDDPLSPESLAKRPLPFSSDEYIEAIKNPSIENIIGGAFEALGEKTAPLSFADKQDEIALDLFGKPFIDLEPHEVTKVQQDPRYPQYEPEEGTAGARLAELKGEVTTDLEALATKLKNNEIPPGDYGDARGEILTPYRAIVREYAESFDDPLVKNALNVFGDIIEANTKKVYSEEGFAEETDWDAVTAEIAALDDPTREAIAENTGIGLTETDQDYIDAMSFIGDTKRSIDLPAGDIASTSYFDIEEAAWDTLGPPITAAIKNLGIDAPTDSPDEFWGAVYQQLANEHGPADAVVRLRMLRSPYEQALTQIKQKYRAENPDILDKLQEWGVAGLTQAEVGR